MKSLKNIKILLIVFVVFLCGCVKNSSNKLDKNNVVVVSLCTYYTDKQLELLKSMVDKFNETQGEEEGIIVEVISTGSLRENTKMLIESSEGMAGSIDFPDIFITYKGIYEYLKENKPVIDFKTYFTKKELSEYNENLIKIGKFEDNEKVSMLPLGFSTDITYVNATDFDKFVKSAKLSYSELDTYYGLVKAGEKYYNYTDSLTDTPNDGEALYGNESIVNHILKISRQYDGGILKRENGVTTINLPKSTAKKLWEIYYVPIIKGYMVKHGKFSSEDLKTGKVLIDLGSTATSVYISGKIMNEFEKPREVEIRPLKTPCLNGSEALAYQQGGGVFVSRSSKIKEKASVNFLKWLTNKENNIEFALKLGYMPIRKDNSNSEYIMEEAKKRGIKDTVIKSIITSLKQVNECDMYISPNIKKYEDVRGEMENIFDKDIYKKRKELLENVASGGSYENLIEKYTNERSFEKWYDEITRRLDDALLQVKTM